MSDTPETDAARDYTSPEKMDRLCGRLERERDEARQIAYEMRAGCKEWEDFPWEEKPPPRPFWWSQRCCDKAKQGPHCVCAFNTVCPDHGHLHHGTHD